MQRGLAVRTELAPPQGPVGVHLEAALAHLGVPVLAIHVQPLLVLLLLAHRQVLRTRNGGTQSFSTTITHYV